MAQKKAGLKPATGSILISDPFLKDPNFRRTVILLTDYNEMGAMGFVLNHPLQVKLGAAMMKDLPLTTLFQGGPVQPELLHFIHTFGGALDGAIKVKEGLWWGGEFEKLMEIVRSDDFDPRQFKFFIGYSGWAPGQLEMEIEENAWIVGGIAAEEAIANEIDSVGLWSRTLKNMGGDYAMMANFPNDPRLN